ncbi:putative serine esterase-domain-containing protein [Aspergillus crustosus]
MLLTPRTYSASQAPDRRNPKPNAVSLTDWHPRVADAGCYTNMVLIRQTGSVRVGEVVRYTLTYKPAADGSCPSPTALYLKIKNTSAIPLRAAYLHGPYTLYVSCYPTSFDPNSPADRSDAGDVPRFEPYLKAGGTWDAVIPTARFKQPEESPSAEHPNQQPITWIIEIISQVVFSSSASVNYEVLVGRDELSMGLLAANWQPNLSKAADLREHWPSGSNGKQLLATKGVFSNALTLLIDDTASLWNYPHLPSWNYNKTTDSTEFPDNSTHFPNDTSTVEAAGLTAGLQVPSTSQPHAKSRQKIHLVMLTHGLHSNLGADMLYLKESIDAASRRTSEQHSQCSDDHSIRNSPTSCSGPNVQDVRDSQQEQIIVRGFPGNAARTERGIQYLGKRLAKYVLLMTFPDQPHLPPKKVKANTFPGPFFNWRVPQANDPGIEPPCIEADLPPLDEHHQYQITSISFIGHSLGGLVQTYAIAYIQKHSPAFFEKIRPINFIALATPFLGLSNENPMYVRFALDFGLVGRTGQDLGLSWTAPRIRSGWETIIGGQGGSFKAPGHADARAKPLLRILPSGPAHDVLTKFQRRTIYSNLVNDGIVPLRTSCLLFLDWKGLERVEKARRENGIVGTMAEWGWAELTGANSKSPRTSHHTTEMEMANATKHTGKAVDETSLNAAAKSCLAMQPSSSSASSSHLFLMRKPATGSLLDLPNDLSGNTKVDGPLPPTLPRPLTGIFSIFKAKERGHKHLKILKRSQTLSTPPATDLITQDGSSPIDIAFNAPPQTTFFESAGDILMPPLPSVEYIVNPESRPRTVMHDRIYFPEDVPRTVTKQESPLQTQSPMPIPRSAEHSLNQTGLKVEEKIARAYHRGLSWRKVLVRLEPDAHNNIIVRRMFTNAYGWPVVQHLVDTHFGPDSLKGSDESCANMPENLMPAVGVPDECDYERTGRTRVVLNTRAD